jgi:putative PIN family toxin of toxin-antitoxin system
VKPRVVLDTNVLVSGLLGGAATDVIRRWRAGDVQMVLSPDIMAEYEDVLNRPKFKLPRWVVQDLLTHIRERADWVTPDTGGPTVARDPSDDKFLFAAVSGRANWIVSADPDLLDLEAFSDIPIVPTWKFLSLLDS